MGKNATREVGIEQRSGCQRQQVEKVEKERIEQSIILTILEKKEEGVVGGLLFIIRVIYHPLSSMYLSNLSNRVIHAYTYCMLRMVSKSRVKESTFFFDVYIAVQHATLAPDRIACALCSPPPYHPRQASHNKEEVKRI